MRTVGNGAEGTDLVRPPFRVRTGTTLGSYELVRPIGSGATGVVYEGVHRSLGRRVAVKVLHAPAGDAAHAERAMARFLREGRAPARVRHPNVVDLFDCGVQDGVPFLVMELVEGQTLAQLLRRETKLPLGRAVEILLPILSAVAELHAAGIVHRDIKPANVLLARERDEVCPKLSDFGLSRLDDGSPSITRSGAVLGTLEYMAPELTRAGAVATEGTDLYALGVTLYEMTTGERPFRGATSYELMQAVTRAEVVAPSAREPSLPKRFDEVVLRAMHRDPDARFASADEVAGAVLCFASASTAAPWPIDLERASTTTMSDGSLIGVNLKGVEENHAANETPTSGNDNGRTASQKDRDAAPLRRDSRRGEDHVARQIGLRRALSVACAMWAAFFLIDLAAIRYLHAGLLQHFAELRIVVFAVLVLAALRLRRTRATSDRTLVAADLLAYSSAAVGIALMCVEFRGLASPYVPGCCVVLLGRSVTAQEPWRRGLAMNGIPVASFFAILIGAALFSPAIAIQMRDPAAITTLLINSAYLLSTYVLLVICGHIVWSLRRQVFEARSVGRYRLKRRIGGGANGDVWLAHHAALKRDVAVKILRPESYSDVGISRFEREVHATAKLAHPNTVRIFDFGVTEDGLWYYAMELLKGETLAELVRRDGPLLPSRAVHLALQAARALGEAHSRRIVHRDVKPTNLFVTEIAGEREFVKVLDFGIARSFHMNGKAHSTLTADGSILGTPAYISPEAVLGREVDARADVYAMGAVLYFMLTGRPPFETTDDGAIGVLLAHVHQTPEAPSSKLRAVLPAELEAVVMRCLEKDPEARYESATALVTALKGLSPNEDLSS